MSRNGSGVYSLPAGSTFTPGTLADCNIVNAINVDIATDLNTPRPIVAGGTGASTVAGAQAALGLSTGTFGLLFGLNTTNNVSDASNSIDVGPGTAAEEGVASPNLMTVATTISKSVAVAWTAGGTTGSPAGGLDTGSVSATSTYHIWLIQRSDTNAVDILLSLSSTSPTMPANYNRKRRIGSFIRRTSVNVAYRQFGDIFKLNAPFTAISGVAGYASLLTTMGVPGGISVQPIFTTRYQVSASSTGSVIVGDATLGGLDVSVAGASASAGGSARADTFTNGGLFTNSSGQIYTSMTISGTCTLFDIRTTGWIDTRGRIS